MPTFTTRCRAIVLVATVASAGIAACSSTAAPRVPAPVAHSRTPSVEPVAAGPPAQGPVQAVWRHHQTTINYFGLTAQYSCDGLQDKVRTLLLYLGARPDLKVEMLGCDRAFNEPGHLSAVTADFYTLAPVAAAADGATAAAAWTSLNVKPHVPAWMDYGECELIQQVKPVIAEDFTVRGLNYRTACLPYDQTISDYAVRGEFLKPLASH